MKNTVKGFIIGFVMASLIVGSVTAGVNQYLLTPASYPVIVDGQELNDPNYPVLNYEGTTYLSLKKTAEALDADLNWNEEKRQVEINNKKQESTIITESKEKVESKTEVEKGDTMQKEVFKTIKGFGVDILPRDGEQYISLHVFKDYIIKKDGKRYIELPNQDAKLISEHSIKDWGNRTFVKLSSFNLLAEYNNDEIILYYIESTTHHLNSSEF